MSKRVFVVIAVGYSDYFTTTLPALHHLARRLGCDFHVVHNVCNHCLPHWLKLTVLRRFLDYGRVIVADADMLPNFANLSDEDLLPLISGDNPVLAIDQGLPMSNESFVAWVLRHTGTNLKAGQTYYNSGFFSLPQALATQLSEAFEAWGKTPSEGFNDQNFFNYWLQANQIAVDVLPTAMNWMAPQFEEATLRQAKIIHFAGTAKGLIARYSALLAAPLTRSQREISVSGI